MRRGNNSGLTLVEVLAAVLIATIFMLAVGAVVQSTVDSISRVEGTTRAQEIAEGVFQVLTGDFRFLDAQQWYSFGINNDTPSGETEITRILLLEPRFLESGPVMVAYIVEPSSEYGGEWRLLRRESSLEGDLVRTEVVYDRLISARLLCLDCDEWVDEWDVRERRRLPPAVRWELEIVVPSGAGPEEHITRQYDIVIELFAVSFQGK